MSHLKASHASFLRSSRTLIDNASQLPEFFQPLAGFGYSPSRFEEGRRLWAEAEAALLQGAQGRGEARASTEELRRAWRLANGSYQRSLKLLRLAFPREGRAEVALGLRGSRRRSLAGWLGQASAFYANLLGAEELGAGLARYGYDASRLREEASLVEAVARRAGERRLRAGAVQAATARRGEKIAELAAWVGELRSVCRLAFADRPQELEKLGILVRSRPRPKRPAAGKGATVSAAPAGRGR